MKQLGAKIFLTNDIEEYTDSELKSLETLITTEINNRQNRKQQKKAWAELCDAFKKYDSKYGIIFEDTETSEQYMMISVDEEDCNTFYFS